MVESATLAESVALYLAQQVRREPLDLEPEPEVK